MEDTLSNADDLYGNLSTILCSNHSKGICIYRLYFFGAGHTYDRISLVFRAIFVIQSFFVDESIYNL